MRKEKKREKKRNGTNKKNALMIGVSRDAVEIDCRYLHTDLPAQRL